ncbi:MAG: MgtC/SapB family protein, partial [Gammaproteobacteria bacterium]|nr:MgtC/SapB family protein [Gammaproteobacteria bacterium]
MELFERLAVALAIGLLIGIERGWHEREAGEGRRIAGLRTFGIIGLLGAVSGLLADELGELLLAATFIAFAALVIAAHVLESREDRDFGMTTPVAALLTFTLGTLAALGYTAVAGATAVVTATLLGLKPLLHRWIEQMEQRELYAIFKMLMISVVLLPILPNQGYGPWQALNPYEIWWMVVLIAGISFAGYFAVKIAGSRRGLVITGLFGGLASSTA